jgi:hypothetical protein
LRVNALLFPKLRDREQRVVEVWHAANVAEHDGMRLAMLVSKGDRHVADAAGRGQSAVGGRELLVARANVDKCAEMRCEGSGAP